MIGNLGKDPEVRYTQSGKCVANCTLATTERYRDKNSNEMVSKTEWHNLVAWGNTGELFEKYLTKGSKIFVAGPIRTREWEDKNGTKRYTTEVEVREVEFLSKAENAGNKATEAKPQPAQVVNEEEEDDLPF